MLPLQLQKDTATVRIAPPPPDEEAPVAIAQNQPSTVRIAPPPPDEEAPVAIAQNQPSATDNEVTIRIAPPPPDEEAPVAIAQNQPSATEDRNSDRVTPSPSAPLLALKEADYTDDIGPTPDPEQATQPEAEVMLDFQEMYQIIREVAAADSGDALYTAISADREYDTFGQPAYQQRHFGLAFGLVLFTQESGLLGRLLQILQRRDPVLFGEIFGSQAEALLATTNAPTAQERLQPVGGEVLWSETWVARFRQAGELPACQAAQNETAIEHQFRPMLQLAFELGFTSDRALAMVYDRVVTHGLGGGLRWVVQAAGPLRTSAQRIAALRLLGFDRVAAFQATTDWVSPDGKFTPATHAALVGALRQAGAVLPTTAELMGRLLTAATGTAQQRLIRLHDSPKFEDIVYRLS